MAAQLLAPLVPASIQPKLAEKLEAENAQLTARVERLEEQVQQLLQASTQHTARSTQCFVFLCVGFLHCCYYCSHYYECVFLLLSLFFFCFSG